MASEVITKNDLTAILDEVLPQTESIKSMTLTRTENSYVNATSFGRISGQRYRCIGILHFNLQITTSMPTGTGFTQIGTISPIPNHEILLTLPSQGNSSSIVLQILTTGVINIANTSGTATGTNFFRATVPMFL